jgi:superfamily II DNA/RNA helicase
MIGFLDADALPGDEAISRDAVAAYVIRTEKRRAIDANGNPLFKPRFTQLVPVDWTAGHAEQRALYEAVTEYARDGYNRATKEKQTAVGFLMILMQRLVTSSTAAIRTALERRLEALELPDGQLSLFPEDIAEEWSSLDGQQQLDTVLKTRLKALKDEQKEVELLLSAARRCEARGPDVKAEALLDRTQSLQRDESDPSLKILIFTEFVSTQTMLAEYLERRGLSVFCLNGSMDLDQRQQVQRRFAGDAQILISTDAGGEGLNLQFCHVVVNFDLPWNPMKLEQRIGRVDRIGQRHIVRALNFALDDTAELRVREVLEEKLQRILEEFGVDKPADVLDSEESGVQFEELFAQAIVAPEKAERRAMELADEIRRSAEEARAGSTFLAATEQLDPTDAQKIASHQVPFWTERLALEFLRSQETNGATVRAANPGYDLKWPDGSVTMAAVFTRVEAERSDTTLVSLEDPRVRYLTTSLPVFAPGQPIPSITIPDISDKISGIWSLWRISLQTASGREQRCLAILLTEDGRSFLPTARAIWDRLIDLPGDLRLEREAVADDAATAAYEASRGAAETQGAAIFDELSSAHRQSIARERKKGVHAFAARRRVIERLGLPQVRSYRLRHLDEEERAWREELTTREATLPNLAAILLVHLARAERLQ